MLELRNFVHRDKNQFIGSVEDRRPPPNVLSKFWKFHFLPLKTRLTTEIQFLRDSLNFTIRARASETFNLDQQVQINKLPLVFFSLQFLGLRVTKLENKDLNDSKGTILSIQSRIIPLFPYMILFSIDHHFKEWIEDFGKGSKIDDRARYSINLSRSRATLPKGDIN